LCAKNINDVVDSLYVAFGVVCWMVYVVSHNLSLIS
jgi:hypothetical protein